MISGALYRNLVDLFAGMSAVTVICVSIGLILIVIEFFQPAYKYPTYCGCALIALGVVVRMLGGGTFIMLFYMAFFCVTVLMAAHLIMLVTQKKAWLTHSLALKLRRAMQNDGEGYDYLRGREGVATTDIDGNGHMSLDDVNFFVTGDEFIEKGCLVRVVRVDGDSIRVEGVYSEEDD